MRGTTRWGPLHTTSLSQFELLHSVTIISLTDCYIKTLVAFNNIVIYLFHFNVTLNLSILCISVLTVTCSDVVLKDRPWPRVPRGYKCVSLVSASASRVQSLGLALEGPGLGLVLGLCILAFTTTLFITNIAAILKTSTFNNYVYS